MSVCALVASGLNFDVDSYLPRSPFRVLSVFRKGQIPPKGNPQQQPRPDSGFTVLVGEDQAAELSIQVPAALRFLLKHEKELVRLRGLGVDNLLLDFGVEVGNELQQSHYLTPELMIALAKLKMGLMFSLVNLPRG
jgi:hypothetical protein